MKIKYLDLLRCVTPMKLLCDKEDIPFNIALAVSKNSYAIDSAIEEYLLKKSLLDKKYLAEPSSENRVREGEEENYLRELTELNEKETDIAIEKISRPGLSGITFPPKLIRAITFMLDI